MRRCLAAGIVAATFAVAPPVGAKAPADSTIVRALSDALREDPGISSGNVTVVATKGVVRLQGSVWSLMQKRAVKSEAERIAGVRAVQDELALFPMARSDAEMEDDVRRRLAACAILRRFDVTVRVEEGLARLSGDVHSWILRDEFERVIGEVRGIRGVKNEVRIVPRARRSDGEIRKTIAAAFHRDVYLAGLPISVEVDLGVVTLKGKVGGVHARSRANRIAALLSDGSKVQDRIVIVWWEDRDVRKPPPAPTDDAVAGSVRRALQEDARIRTDGIEVRANLGAVTLSGTVPTLYEEILAERAVWDLVGVGRVENRLQTRIEWRPDAEILEDVLALLRTDSAVGLAAIDARVSNGVIILSGVARTAFDRAHADEIARRVAGGRSLANRITTDWNSLHEDSSLQRRLRDRLASNWETRWVAGGIHVEVTSGQATLSGLVWSWGQRREAARCALLTEGIWSLSNRLRVENFEFTAAEAFGGRPTPGGYDRDNDVRYQLWERRHRPR